MIDSSLGCLKAIKQMISEVEQKKLVENYKATNRQLRKQLENLNNQIDRILAAKINRIGLKKLPQVDKSIQKTNDTKILQLQVDNLRKRLEQLHHDNENLKVRTTVDHMAMAKELQDKLVTKRTEKEELKKQVYQINKNSMNLNTTDLQNEQMKLYDKIEHANQELIRVKKIQADLTKEINIRQQQEQKKSDYIQQSVEHHNRAAQEAQKIMKSRIDVPITHTGRFNEQDWKNIKREFLELKQSKLWEETSLKEDNDRLRAEIRQLQLKLKQKKYTLQNIRSLEIRRKERNYSTLDPNLPRKNNDNLRYRGRNNSYKYSTKN